MPGRLDAAPADTATAAAPPAAATPPPLVSVVVPVRNEAPNIEPLVAEIEAALASVQHEIVYVDDGSTDETPAALCKAGRLMPGGVPLRPLRHRESCGQSAAIATGVRAARGEWIATLDGDGQNDPADIHRLLRRAQAEGCAVLVAGHRVSRRDTWTKRWTSRVANRVRARLLGDRTPDTGCGLKVFPRALFLDLPRFDHMHRFLPALVLRAGGRVVSEPVNHRPRLRGRSNYGTLDRLAVSLFDLVGVAWLQRRGSRPVVERAPAEPEA
jgi:dolichol-phosphate mannosyltransferase